MGLYGYWVMGYGIMGYGVMGLFPICSKLKLLLILGSFSPKLNTLTNLPHTPHYKGRVESESEEWFEDG